MEDIKLKKILSDITPGKIKKVIVHPYHPWVLICDSKNTVSLYSYTSPCTLLNTFTPYTLLEDSDNIKMPSLGVTLRSVCFSDMYTLKYSSLSQMGFTLMDEEFHDAMPNYITSERKGTEPNANCDIIFVFDQFIIFHDYTTKKNRYLQKSDIDSKGFASCIGVSRDFVAIGSVDGWITMFKLSEWSVGRLLSKGYHTKAITAMDTLVRYRKSYIVSASSDGL
jgi:hypothetical protein